MADRYFVALGTGNWNSITNWAATDGGLPGASFPVAGDNVFLTGTPGAVTLTVNVASACANLNCTGWVGTIAGTSALAITGDITRSSVEAAFTYTGTITLNGGINQTVTSNGKSWASSFTQSTASTNVVLADDLNVTDNTKTYTHTNGDLNIGARTLTIGLFSSNNANTRSITSTGAGNITVTGIGVSLTMATMTGFTQSGTTVFNQTNSTATARTASIGNTAGPASPETNAPTLNITAGTMAQTLTGGCILRNLNFAGYTGALAVNTTARTLYGDLTLGTGMTFAGDSSGDFLFSKTSGTQKITTNGVSVMADVDLTTNITLQLQDNITFAGVRRINATAASGIVDLNGKSYFPAASGTAIKDLTAGVGTPSVAKLVGVGGLVG